MTSIEYATTVEDAKGYLRRALDRLEGKIPPPSFAPLNCDAMEIAVEAVKNHGWTPQAVNHG